MIKFNALHFSARNIEATETRNDVQKVLRDAAQNAFDTIFLEQGRDACEFESIAQATLMSVLSDFHGYLKTDLRCCRVKVWFADQGFNW